MKSNRTRHQHCIELEDFAGLNLTIRIRKSWSKLNRNSPTRIKLDLRGTKTNSHISAHRRRFFRLFYFASVMLTLEYREVAGMVGADTDVGDQPRTLINTERSLCQV